jgi:hypothetical protein
VPRATLTALEQAARRYGLDLESLELLGQDAEAAKGFIAAFKQGLAKRYLETVDFEELRLTRHTRERFPERLAVSAAPPALVPV